MGGRRQSKSMDVNTIRRAVVEVLLFVTKTYRSSAIYLWPKKLISIYNSLDGSYIPDDVVIRSVIAYFLSKVAERFGFPTHSAGNRRIFVIDLNALRSMDEETLRRELEEVVGHA